MVGLFWPGKPGGRGVPGAPGGSGAPTWPPPYALIPPTVLTECTGKGRGLSGNPSLIGKQGGIPGQTVQSGTAAVIPQQFGVQNGAALSRYAPAIFGSIGEAFFSAVTDVIGGESPIPGTNVRTALQQLFPGQLILEIPGASDQGANAPVIILFPQGLGGCPVGTSPAGGGVGSHPKRVLMDLPAGHVVFLVAYSAQWLQLYPTITLAPPHY